jgi:hypothetical protein
MHSYRNAQRRAKRVGGARYGVQPRLPTEGPSKERDVQRPEEFGLDLSVERPILQGTMAMERMLILIPSRNVGDVPAQ